MKAGNKHFVPVSNYGAAYFANGLFIMKLNLHAVHLNGKVYKYFSSLENHNNCKSTHAGPKSAVLLFFSPLRGEHAETDGVLSDLILFS